MVIHITIQAAAAVQDRLVQLEIRQSQEMVEQEKIIVQYLEQQ